MFPALKKIQSEEIEKPEVWQPSRSGILVGDPSGLLTASFGCSGLVTHTQAPVAKGSVKDEEKGKEKDSTCTILESRYTKVISTAYIEISSSKVSDHFWTKNHPHWQQLEWH